MAKAKPKPTRIVAPPRRDGNKVFYLCDDGNWYQQKDFAELFGKTKLAISKRIQKYGYDHPRLFDFSWPMCDVELMRELKRRERKYNSLSTRVRTENLRKIKLGTFETAEMWETIR